MSDDESKLKVAGRAPAGKWNFMEKSFLSGRNSNSSKLPNCLSKSEKVLLLIPKSMTFCSKSRRHENRPTQGTQLRESR
jgi:hypothetical protein